MLSRFQAGKQYRQANQKNANSGVDDKIVHRFLHQRSKAGRIYRTNQNGLSVSYFQTISARFLPNSRIQGFTGSGQKSPECFRDARAGVYRHGVQRIWPSTSLTRQLQFLWKTDISTKEQIFACTAKQHELWTHVKKLPLKDFD